MLLSIIIRCKNEEKSIGRTLEKIYAQAIDIQYEVIIVDSGSTDLTLEIVQQYPVRIFRISPESFTFGYALNYGIEKADGRIIVNLSAHCFPLDDYWLSRLVTPILEGNADACYGRQVPIKEINPFEEVSLYKHFPDDEKKAGRVPFSNANCAFLKKMWEEVRFDEKIPSWEDYLWFIHLEGRYSFKYCSEAAVYHTHSFSLKAILRRAHNDGRAFSIFKRAYNIDLLGDACPGLNNKAKMFLDDLRGHARFFHEEGYTRYIFFIPFVRFCTYMAYLSGYRSLK
ncbi:MAG: glycosyl transferase family 2 [Nitrospirae bacterium]|nr:glycosyl transferase family 2 [Nitrospirota bacterium]